ncbi:anthranilate phosphoribosyltransferase [Bacillus pseudomycoides]|uniref:Anthranilate phosphoribosyltransferase n=1 Tax=Bacillus pseudomycoides TaxID=64104 RepID=A0AA91V913_9BACI|nr:MULTISPECIES: anthranilate phosphoribosyltransferase [Bacillus]PEB52858.1 anthranilate phosphoribosyltransferase [Bacillus sp. AFS098217]PED80752.1 anthranilate phosphoribosyltransferase [Bacillus pseudomycoides]PEU08072.1 anthranilate phosphoribosyltransferase [Bacillus sp. AFS019443]PEU16617.1 anthranilate phosphoribosyltransferase [Bacillus sp. AFS014408]PFW64201.1 anthranilate phosphoribosyltransferase [Bacillus sp. AFS075034]
MNHYLRKLVEGQNLTEQEMYTAGLLLLSEDILESEIAAFLALLKAKGETADEIYGLVRALREKALPFSSHIKGAMDNCGTGGDGAQTFNISTTSAFVLAGAGVKVAKHGNRAVSSKTGSADLLEELGVNISCTPSEIDYLLENVGIAFLFAPAMHPALRRIMKIRKELNVPTIFNLIGPLTNPIDLETQFVGIYKRDMLLPVAEVLQKLGRKQALVVNGSGFLDEASLQGENHVVILKDNEIIETSIVPEKYGFSRVKNEEIRGGNPKENAKITLQVLKGEKSVYRDTVLLNAGLALFANGRAETIGEGIQLAAHSIDSGKALAKLQLLIAASHEKLERVN